jgi:hypothetical protein
MQNLPDAEKEVQDCYPKQKVTDYFSNNDNLKDNDYEDLKKLATTYSNSSRITILQFNTPKLVVIRVINNHLHINLHLW